MFSFVFYNNPFSILENNLKEDINFHVFPFAWTEIKWEGEEWKGFEVRSYFEYSLYCCHDLG